MNICIVLFKLREPYVSAQRLGISRLLASGAHAPLGDNSFLFASTMMPAQICDQLRPHLVSGEHLFVFAAGSPYSYAADASVALPVEQLLPGSQASRREVPPPVG
jgi:hypothetical protein